MFINDRPNTWIDVTFSCRHCVDGAVRGTMLISEKHAEGQL